MRQCLGQNGEFKRQRRQRDRLEAAILVICEEEPVEREQRGEQGRHPDDARADPRQQLRRRPDPEWEENHGKNKKGDDHRRVAALAQRQPQVAANHQTK